MDYCEEFLPLFSKLKELMKKDGAVIVSVDGRCGSGKTYLASMIKTQFDCNVFHIDDYYLPLSERNDNWEQIPAGNIDLNRFRNDVLLPSAAYKAVKYIPYNCGKCKYGDAVTYLPKKLTVIEGSYSHHLLLNKYYDLKIFLSCTRDVQRRRLIAREGGSFSQFERYWIPMEELYFTDFCVASNSDILIDTSKMF